MIEEKRTEEKLINGGTQRGKPSQRMTKENKAKEKPRVKKTGKQ